MVSKLEDKLLNLAEIFALIDNSSITLNQGSKLLTYSYWHFIRLFQKYRKVGLKNRFKLEKKSKPRKLSDNDKVLLKVYYLKLNKPQISLLHFFLRLDYPSFPVISQEWIRKTLIRDNIYSPGVRKKTFRNGFEAPLPGLLVQGDSTLNQWIPEDDNYYQLIAFLDDCSRFCLGAKLVVRDSIDEHFSLLKEIVKEQGKFVALYYDNDEKYSYIRHGNSRIFEYANEKSDLQLVRALSELGIMGIICRRFDPCGKGKMERFIETAILQLPVWFRRYEVKSKTLGNLVLEKYIRYYNMVEMHREIKTTAYDRFSALRKESKFTLIVDDEVDLDKVFSYREERKANGDNTIRFNGEVYQLERKPFIYSYAGKKAEIRYLPDKFLSIYLDGELVTYRKLLTVTKERLKSESEKYGKVATL